MRHLLPLAFVVLAGCSGDEAVKEVAKAVEEPATVELAGKAVRTEGIGMSWEGITVRVGDTWEAASKLFVEPSRNAFRLRSLPERFGPSFAAHGWETNEGQGYGVITYKDLVVAAIYHSEDVEPGYADKLLNAQRANTGSLEMKEVENGALKWHFWENDAQRLMVLFDKGDKGTDVTILMGDSKVLDALGATKPAVRNPAIAPFIDTPPARSGNDSP